MYDHKWRSGYVMLPCFTIRWLENTHEAEMTCADWLQKVFEIFFAPFWSGRLYVRIPKEEEDDA